MKLKTTEINGAVYAEVQDGKPVYAYEDGKELPYDAIHSAGKIKELNAEAKKHREAKEAAESKLQGFDGLDPDSARKAFETLKNIDDKKLIDAGQVEKVKQQANEAYEQKLQAYQKQYEPVLAERDALKNQLHTERLSTAFGRSKFITEKVAIPVDFVQSKFGAHFSVGDDGRIRAMAVDGNPIFSRAKPGEEADFDEALELLVESHPHRDHILKGTGVSGGGSSGYRTDASGKRTVSRAEFEKMDPVKQRETALSGADIAD